MKIHFPTTLRKDFSVQAKKAFPNETFAVCLGREINDRSLITTLYYPPIKLFPNGRGFTIPPDSWSLVEYFANYLNLTILLTLHTHPFPHTYNADDAGPSETDMDNLCLYYPAGICSVVEKPNGKLTCRYRFWPKIPKLDVTND